MSLELPTYLEIFPNQASMGLSFTLLVYSGKGAHKLAETKHPPKRIDPKATFASFLWKIHIIRSSPTAGIIDFETNWQEKIPNNYFLLPRSLWTLVNVRCGLRKTALTSVEPPFSYQSHKSVCKEEEPQDLLRQTVVIGSPFSYAAPYHNLGAHSSCNLLHPEGES